MKYVNHAIIPDPLSSDLYVLLACATSDRDGYNMYELYKYRSDSRTIDRDRLAIYYVQRTRRRRYAPFVFNTIILLSWGISSLRLSTNMFTFVNQDTLDVWFTDFLSDYDAGLVDIPFMLAP